MQADTTQELSTVLIADDATVMRETLGEILGAEDYCVVGEAANSAEVVDQVKRLRPDVVALDMVMPGSTGIATLRSILDVSPMIRVVMCSSLGQDELVAEALQEGAQGFILKPFCPVRTLRTFDRVANRECLSAPAPPRPESSFLRRTAGRAVAALRGLTAAANDLRRAA